MVLRLEPSFCFVAQLYAQPQKSILDETSFYRGKKDGFLLFASGELDSLALEWSGEISLCDSRISRVAGPAELSVTTGCPIPASYSMITPNPMGPLETRVRFTQGTDKEGL